MSSLNDDITNATAEVISNVDSQHAHSVSPTGEAEDVAFFVESAQDELMIQAVFRRC